MSYDLAVWEGDPPADDDAAIAEFEILYERYIGGAKVTPTDRIIAYVTALLDRYPDINTAAGYQDSPWASAWAARLAGEHGLVCFDPMLDQLRTS